MKTGDMFVELKIEGLSKTYANGVRALDDVSLAIGPGMFGLLGPNGAGKSTLMRILATLQEPDQGNVSIGGVSILEQADDVRKILGYLPQEFGVYPRTSASSLLSHFALLKGVVNRAERRELVGAMLQRVNLYQHRFKSLSGFSGGMKQRFGIAQALLCNPKLVIVDEPTAGLDPSERNRFYNLLADISGDSIVVLSTHIVQDVRELCSSMAILNNGRVVFSGAPSAAVDEFPGRIWQHSIDKHKLTEFCVDNHVLSTKYVAGRPLVHVLSEQSPGAGFKAIKPDLEDVFFSMTRGEFARSASPEIA